MLSAPTSLASIMVIGPHHAAVTHVGDSSEVGQREQHLARQGFTRKCWSEFLCLGGYLAPPPRQVGWGVCPAGCALPTPLRRPPPLAHRPPAGPWQEPPIGYRAARCKPFGISRLAASNLHDPRAFTAGNIANSLPTVRIPSTLWTSGFYGVLCWSAESACSKAQVLIPDEHGV
jgi:hypothetical protein